MSLSLCVLFPFFDHVCASTDGAQIYRNNDKPYYHVGNTVLLGITAYNIVLFIASKFYYIWRNRYVCFHFISFFLFSVPLSTPTCQIFGSRSPK